MENGYFGHDLQHKNIFPELPFLDFSLRFLCSHHHAIFKGTPLHLFSVHLKGDQVRNSLLYLHLYSASKVEWYKTCEIRKKDQDKNMYYIKYPTKLNIVGGWSMYIPIQTNKPSIKTDEELINDLKTIKNQTGEFS